MRIVGDTFEESDHPHFYITSPTSPQLIRLEDKCSNGKTCSIMERIFGMIEHDRSELN